MKCYHCSSEGTHTLRSLPCCCNCYEIAIAHSADLDFPEVELAIKERLAKLRDTNVDLSQVTRRRKSRRNVKKIVQAILTASPPDPAYVPADEGPGSSSTD